MVFQNCLIGFYFNPFSAFCKRFFNFFRIQLKNTILIKIELFPKHHDDHQQYGNNHHQIHKKSSHSRMMVPLFICLRLFFLNLFKPLVGMLFNHIVQSIVIAMMIDSVRCHPKTLPNQLIKTIAPIAQKEQKKYHIPASIIIAQAGTESNWGRSKLAYKYNNLFGIKATSKKNRVRMYTKENINGKMVEVKQYFAVYDSWDASLKAHAELLAHGTKAKPNVFKDILNAKNYQEAAWALQKDGYATDPNYANELIYAIKKFNLDKYDK